MQNDEQAIRDLIASWLVATADGDVNRVVSLMAEDVVFLLPGQPPMTGKSAFAEGFKAAVAKFRIEATGHVQEMRVSGELAYCWSQLAVVMTPHAGGHRVAVLETSCRSSKSYPAASGYSSAMPIC